MIERLREGWCGGCLALLLLLPGPGHAQVQKLEFDAPAFAPERLHVTVYLPPGYASSSARYPVLYANDGQDMSAVALQATLATLYGERAIEPVIVVAVKEPVLVRVNDLSVDEPLAFVPKL